uniref:Lipid-binding serum glycoprotein N-terminal domain-containing protein n=1 Tax=Poecilia mexicana TaxID=48701 RepID=A0A3B3XCQ0_9TELE
MYQQHNRLLQVCSLCDLPSLEIYNLSIGRSDFELRSGEGIGLEINNVSAVFSGTIQYGYGSWLMNVGHRLDFEVETQIDLGINPKLYCGNSKVAADTSDCYLNFHKFRLYLEGDKEPNWLKKLFTDFITFTVKLVVKGQICKEINKLADILAEFIQDTAADFLSDGGISVDIGVTTTPLITANYIESYHKGLTTYLNLTSVINASVFHPDHLTENRMLYFWFSDEVFKPLIAAAHHDGRFQLNISSEELKTLFETNLSSIKPEYVEKVIIIKKHFPRSVLFIYFQIRDAALCLAAQCLLGSASPELRAWSSSVPTLNTSTVGTSVWAQATGELYCGSRSKPTLSFQTNIAVDVTASYADKKLFLHGKPRQISVIRAELPQQNTLINDEAQVEFIREAVEKIGVPKVLSVLEVEITRLMDKQGANLFDIIDPEVLHQEVRYVFYSSFFVCVCINVQYLHCDLSSLVL